jgi:hypothetical protein
MDGGLPKRGPIVAVICGNLNPPARVLHVLEPVANKFASVEPIMDQAALFQATDDTLEVPDSTAAR